MFFDPLYFIIIAPGIALALWAQWRVKSAYARAQEIPASSRMTGAETAHAMLESHGIRGVNIEPAQGFLSDHYDPRHKVLRLSPDVYSGRSVAAAGIAAHEAGHAIQDARHYAPLKLRNGIVPFAAIGGQFSWLLIIFGLGLAGASRGFGLGEWMLWAGIGLFSLTVLFQLINLPVEFDASRRAKDLLTSTGLVAPGTEAAAMNKVLNAAALTYVAATVTAALTLLYYLLRAGALSGNNR